MIENAVPKTIPGFTTIGLKISHLNLLFLAASLCNLGCSVASTVRSSSSVALADTINYHGVVAPPTYDHKGPHYGNAPSSITYSANCFGHPDPSADDGFAGCLGMIGNARYAPKQFGAFSIEKPAPVAAEKRDVRYLPKEVKQGQEVIPIVDPSIAANGKSIYQSLSARAAGEGWTNREMTGIAVLRDGGILHTCARDWYNVGEKIFPSHCLATIKNTKPSSIGPFTFRCPRGYRDLCHTEMVGAYVGTITDQDYADRVFAANGFSKPGEEICLTGDMRAHGAKKSRSQGMGLYAFRCADMTKKQKGAIDAIPILHHASRARNFNDNLNANLVKFPQYSSKYKWSPINRCYDIAWGEFPVKNGAPGQYEDGMFVACTFGGSVWWYGQQDPWNDPNAFRARGKNNKDACLFNKDNPQTKAGVECEEIFRSLGDPIPPGFVNPCDIDKGYHGVAAQVPYKSAVLLFYRAEDLAASAKATMNGRNRAHLGNVPFEVVLDMPAQVWNQECGGFNGVAFDPANKRLFVQEKNARTPLIHIFSM